MPRFTNEEYADMHFVYGFCDGNSRRAEEEYRLRYPHRRAPNRAVFAAVHQRLRESGSFGREYERGHDRRSATVEEYVIDRVEEDPSVSQRTLAREGGIAQSKVVTILHKNQYHPYHFTAVQELRRSDFQKRVTFCRWLLERDIEEHHFLRTILWTDESLFTRDGILNLHNWHHYAQENPFVTRNSSFQTRFSLNVWLGLVGDRLIGPHVFQGHLTSDKYLEFLEHHLPGLLDVIPAPQRAEIIFQQDGAPAHSSNVVRDFLTEQYPRWIGRTGPIPWPPRSPDLTPLDFFVWGFLKQEVYRTEVASLQDLSSRLDEAIVKLRDELSLRATVVSVRKRARACIRCGGDQFQQRL